MPGTDACVLHVWAGRGAKQCAGQRKCRLPAAGCQCWQAEILILSCSPKCAQCGRHGWHLTWPSQAGRAGLALRRLDHRVATRSCFQDGTPHVACVDDK